MWLAVAPPPMWRPALTFVQEKPPVYPSVHNAFLGFTAPLEGHTDWLYADEIGKITIGYGNMLPSVEDALALDWGGASADTVRAAWAAIEASPVTMRKDGGGEYQHLPGNEIRATQASIARLVESRLAEIDRAMLQAFPSYTTWPADAQLGVLSMGWAMGPGFLTDYPHFAAFARAGDWENAALECAIHRPVNRSIARRNAANAQLFRNAAKAVSDLSILQWTSWAPRMLVAQSQNDTEPDPEAA